MLNTSRLRFLKRSGGDTGELALAGAAFLSTTSFGLTVPILPLFLRQLAAPGAAESGLWAGLAIGISPLFSAMAMPLWGTLGDRFGHKIMMQRALACMALTLFLLALAAQPWHVVVLRAMGGAFGGLGAAITAAVSVSIPQERLGHSIGTIQTAQTMGLLVGPIAGGVLSDLVGPRLAFATGAVCLGIGLTAVSRRYRDPPRLARRPAPSPGLAARLQSARTAVGAIRPLWVLLPSLFAIQFVDGGYTVLLPFHLEALGAPAPLLARLVGGTLSATAIAMAVATVSIGRTVTPPRVRGLLAMMLGAGAGFSVLAAVSSAWWFFAACRVLLGFTLGAVPTLVYVAAAASSPTDRQGVVLGMVTSVGLIAWASSPLLTGALTASHPRWVLGFYVALCGSAVMVLGWNRRPELRGTGDAAMRPPGLAGTLRLALRKRQKAVTDDTK
ncbi:MAG: MFS transporter [Armatimonadetes bacterium]|nr:MFS transporter [Armatimonadota bacterium]